MKKIINEYFLTHFTTNSFIVSELLLGLVLAAFTAWLLAMFYVRFGKSLSNKKAFARNLVPLAMVTMFVITVVKSSLALSLGLVGALSIIRFRTVIKEPEELIYLFLAIGIGLGCGSSAQFRAFTPLIYLVIFIALWLNNQGRQSTASQHFYLNISSTAPTEAKLDKITNLLQKNCTTVKLKRLDENQQAIELSFMIVFKTAESLPVVKTELLALSSNITVSCFDATRDN